MDSENHLSRSILNTWKTGNRGTCYLIEHIPNELWNSKIPGYQQKTVRMIGGHLHNTRCMWIKKVGKHFDLYRFSRKQLISKLDISSQSVLTLLEKHWKVKGPFGGFQWMSCIS